VAELVRDVIPVQPLMKAVTRPDCGAIALFVGTTRDHHEGKKVETLSYEAYDAMAVAALSAIEEEATRRFEIKVCRIVHRLGEVPIIEASVMVAVAAAHREPAFEACRWAMNELKRTVPIWKKEHYAEGGESWVEGTRLG